MEVPLKCPKQCQAPTVKPLINHIPVPGPAPVPVPRHTLNLPPRDPSPGCLSPSGLALLPVPVQEAIHNILGSPTDSSDHSGSSPKGAASQPVPELVMETCKPLVPTMTSSPPSQSSADKKINKDSAISQLADEFKELQRLVVELIMNAPTSAIKETGTGGTSMSPSDSVPLKKGHGHR
ncbi:sterol regulatory element-binding protein 1-like [Macrobrachium rosenbergii]|uniref:sterol regulatory element-binding protein 1-like n=1 Tax=Macrobrachium rosenbergii TaxID=79674 RepID=UPI0034D3DF6B